ncbi:MAG: hypothetical protein C4324_00130 [Blastocatellia bacterium]
MQNLVDTVVPGKHQLVKLENSFTSRCGRQLPITDTTIVLFFLALEIGSRRMLDFVDAAFGILVVAAFMTFPYWISADPRRWFAEWLAGRAIIAMTGLTIGSLFGLAIGLGALPAVTRYIPLTLLIVAAAVSCNYWIYVIIRYRLAR